MSAAIDLYWVKVSAPCRSVQMVAKHLNIPLNLKPVDLLKGEHLTEQFIEMNAAHKVPTIDDNGFVLSESRAILAYLCNQYAPDSDLYPKEPKSRAVVDRMLNFDIGSFYHSIREAILLNRVWGQEIAEDKFQALKNNLKLLDTFLGENRYVAGNHLTIADLSILVSSTQFTAFDYDISDYPRVKEWYERLQKELPYYDEINGKIKEEYAVFAEQVRQWLANKKGL